MKFLILLVSIFMLSNCSGTKQDRSQKENTPLRPEMKIIYKQDKQQIADCFIKNVEYFRKYHRYTNDYDSIKKLREGYSKRYPGADWTSEEHTHELQS